jgi:hypothetical protein
MRSCSNTILFEIENKILKIQFEQTRKRDNGDNYKYRSESGTSICMDDLLIFFWFFLFFELVYGGHCC